MAVKTRTPKLTRTPYVGSPESDFHEAVFIVSSTRVLSSGVFSQGPQGDASHFPDVLQLSLPHTWGGEFGQPCRAWWEGVELFCVELGGRSGSADDL